MKSKAIEAHRARQPENTLPSFEAAIDSGVDSIEIDLRVSQDGVWIIHHDPCVLSSGSPIDQLTAAKLNTVVVAHNPDPARFPLQRPDLLPRSESFAKRHFPPPSDAYAIPTLAQAIAFVAECSNRVILDLEIKSVPPVTPVHLKSLAELLSHAKVLSRCRVRSFDHGLVKGFKGLLPTVETAVLVADVSPSNPVNVAVEAGAAIYCPEYRLLSEPQVEELHQAGLRVIPWTVNDSADWSRLVDWDVDGLTTDDPAALREWLDRYEKTR